LGFLGSSHGRTSPHEHRTLASPDTGPGYYGRGCVRVRHPCRAPGRGPPPYWWPPPRFLEMRDALLDFLLTGRGGFAGGLLSAASSAERRTRRGVIFWRTPVRGTVEALRPFTDVPPNRPRGASLGARDHGNASAASAERQHGGIPPPNTAAPPPVGSPLVRITARRRLDAQRPRQRACGLRSATMARANGSRWIAHAGRASFGAPGCRVRGWRRTGAPQKPAPAA
jgi:hypothetical protein